MKFEKELKNKTRRIGNSTKYKHKYRLNFEKNKKLWHLQRRMYFTTDFHLKRTSHHGSFSYANSDKYSLFVDSPKYKPKKR